MTDVLTMPAVLPEVPHFGWICFAVPPKCGSALTDPAGLATYNGSEQGGIS